MLPHTALRTARPSWQPAAPVPVSEPGRRAVARQRGPGRPWGRLRGGADRRARPYADPVGPSRVRGSGGPGRVRPIRRVRAARRAGPSRARGCIRSHRARTGRARGADTGRTWSRERHVGAREAHVGADGCAGASRRWGRGRVRSAGAGASRRWGRGRGRVSSRASHARGAVRNRTPPPGPSIGVPRALPGRSQDGQVRGACASGMREGGHSRWGVAALVVPRGHAPSAGCLGADRPRRCCPGGYLPLAASLSFEPAETFTL